jgi:hypothetical protein
MSCVGHFGEKQMTNDELLANASPRPWVRSDGWGKHINDAKGNNVGWAPVLDVNRELELLAVNSYESHLARIKELEGALRRMKTQFYAHDCLNNIDCRRCKALDNADAALGETDAVAQTLHP